MTPTLGDVLKIVHYCRFGSQFSQNVYRYNITAWSGGGLTLAQIAQGWSNVAGVLLLPTMPTNVTSYGVTCKKVAPGPQSVVESYVANAAGTSAGTNVSPPQVAPLISLRSTKPSSGSLTRGRHYMPFTARDNVAAGVLTAGAIALYQAFLPAFTGTLTLTAGGGSSVDLRYTFYSDIAGTLTNYYVSSAVVNPNLAQQVRRSFYRSGDQIPF